MQRIPSWIFALVIGVLVLSGPWWGFSLDLMRQMEIIAIYALVVTGLNLTLGLAGEFSFATVAIFGFGGYIGGVLMQRGYDLSIALLVAVVGSVVIGLVTGIPGLRLSGWGLAMISFFLLTLLPDVVNIFEEWTGGASGLVGIPRPRLFGVELDRFQYYLVLIAITIVWLAVMRNFVMSRHGEALKTLRTSRILATSLGFNVTLLKLRVYLMAAIPAALAGTLYAGLDRFLVPEFFNLQLAILIIAASILGGRDSVYGAVAGSAILILGPQQVTAFEKYSYFAYGVFLVLAGVFFAGGLANWFSSRVQRLKLAAPEARNKPTDVVAGAPDAIPGETLEIEGATKRFGGVTAVDGVTLTVDAGNVLGLIGANGSGKTTLLNLISGFYPLSDGRITLGGTRLDDLAPHVIAHHGVARTFQTPLVPTGMTARQVVASAVPTKGDLGVLGAIVRLPQFSRRRKAALARAERILDLLGIQDLADRDASSLSLGSRRLVEVARAAASGGSLILLDEPASGLEADEIAELGEVINRLRARGATVVLVEHNFDFVCSVADRLCVLALGKTVAAGPPAEIRDDPVVAATYLGGLDRDDDTPAQLAAAAPREDR